MAEVIRRNHVSKSLLRRNFKQWQSQQFGSASGEKLKSKSSGEAGAEPMIMLFYIADPAKKQIFRYLELQQKYVGGDFKGRLLFSRHGFWVEF